jgi:NACHT conflict system protein/NACHT domain-containing protein
MTVEIVLLQLGTAAVRAAARLWLGDNKVAAEVGVSAVDMLSSRLSSERDRRKLRRLVEGFEESIVDRLEPLIVNEFKKLPDNEREAAILALADTFRKVPLDHSDLFSVDLDAGRLHREMCERAPDMDEGLSSDGSALYNLLMRESCGYVIEIARVLPPFTSQALTELLRRDREIIEGIREVLARLPQRGPEDGFAYDYRQLVARTLDHVELFGVTVAEANRRYPLSIAYISASAVTAEIDVAFNASRRVDELLVGKQRVFIRGEAGLGKTTLLQWLAVRSARGDFPPPLTSWNGLIPFFVPLRRYADASLPSPEGFVKTVGRHIADEMPENWVHRQLRTGKGLLLVDGVDELPPDRRDSVQKWLRELIVAFPVARIIITSRPSGASQHWLAGLDFSVLEMQPMTKADMTVFVERWYAAMRVQQVDELAKVELDSYRNDLLGQLAGKPQLRRLARYPLLCALLCALHRDRGALLPANRMELYEVALQMLLDRRDAQRRVPNQIDLERSVKMILLGDLAYWLIRNEHSDSDVSRVVQRIDGRLGSMPQIKDSSADVFRHLLDRTGLLREPAEGRVDFVHRTFQEYLAARCAVVDSDDIGNLITNAHRDQWHEVVVMAVGHASRKQREELLNGLLERGDASSENRDKLHLLAVACFETAPDIEPELRGRIQERADRLLPPQSLESAKSFASAGQYIVERLAASPPTGETETVATVRALAETGLEEAVEVIGAFGADERPSVQQELVRSWPAFEPVTYAAKVLAKSPIGSLEVRDAALVPGIRHLSNVAHLDDLVPLTTLKDVFPADLASLAIAVLEGVDLADLAPLPLERLILHRTEDATSPPTVDVSPLAVIKTLRSLEIDRVVPLNLQALANTGVRRLRLNRAVSLAELSKMPLGWHLTRLSVTGIVDMRSLQSLMFATGLEELVVRGCTRIADLRGLEPSAHTLRTLIVRDCVAIDLSDMPELAHLTTLDLGAAPVSGIDRIAGMERLKSLTLGRLEDPRALTAAAELPNLCSLTLRGRGLVDLSVLSAAHDLVITVGTSVVVFGQDKLPASCRLQVLENPGDRARPLVSRDPVVFTWRCCRRVS